jgi:hypothetical protein
MYFSPTYTDANRKNSLPTISYSNVSNFLSLPLQEISTSTLPVTLNSTLALAAREGRLNDVQKLIQQGADELNFAMFQAAKNGHVNIVNFLIDSGAKDFKGGIIWAAAGGHLDIVKIMVRKGVQDFDYPIETAEEEGHNNIASYLRKLQKANRISFLF